MVFYRRIGVGNRNRRKALVLSLLWASLLLWSPVAYSSSSSSSIDTKENDNDINTVVVDKLANISGTTTTLQPQPQSNHKNEQEAEDGRQQQVDDDKSAEKEGDKEEVGLLPEGAQLLAGPLPHENLYSNHSCTCHSSSSSSSSFSDDSFSPTTTNYGSTNPCLGNADHRTHTNKDKDNNCAGRIFYLVSIHNNRTLSDALYLFRAIRDARNIILIHIDAKFGLEPYYDSTLHKEIEACPCGSHVEVASVHDCKWGSWSMNLPTLWSMEKAVKEYAGKWDVFINLSGDTLPVYSQNRIAQLFGGPLRGINFVTSIACESGLVPTSILEFPKKWHKRTHYSYHPATELEYVDDEGVIHHNVKVDIYFGSQWMSVTPQYCEFLIRQLARPDSLSSRFRDWLIDTGKLMADETFFTSMLMRYFPETIPKVTEDFFLDTTTSNSSTAGPEVSMYAIRYERMDEHVPSSKGYFPTEQRYEVPASTGMEQPKAWGPYFLGTYDLNNIRLSGALYVRKVAQVIDPNMYIILPVDGPEQIPPISWPSDVQISPVPDWEKTVAQFRKKQAA